MSDDYDPLAAKLHATDDAEVWAAEFMKVYRDRLDQGPGAINEGFMISWFANAIETGKSFARRDWRPSITVDGGGVVTKTGKILTNEDIEALADEAERGYDVAQLVESGDDG